MLLSNFQSSHIITDNYPDKCGTNYTRLISFHLNFTFCPSLCQVRQLLQKSDKGHVIATCRNPDTAPGLVDLKNMFAERLKILPLDVTTESSIEVCLPFDFWFSSIRLWHIKNSGHFTYRYVFRNLLSLSAKDTAH